MLFNSYIFIFLFLPLCLVGFYILQERRATLTKVWLTCFSLWFYGYFNPYYLLIMLCSILGNYTIHSWMMKVRSEEEGEVGRKKSRRLLMTGVGLNLLVLFYFKYFDFFMENVNLLLGSSLPLKNILLPLGISFFTFQQISFLVDTSRGELDVYGEEMYQKGESGKKRRISFLDYTLFVSFFPQLIAGPIVVHEEMLPQFARIGNDSRRKEEKLELLVKGIFVFVLGLAKKVLIADTFGRAVDLAYGNVAALNGLESFLVVMFYSLQLYFDFSGYCDMAKGIAGMFGMQMANNFQSPYKSSNIVEFWRRWHITLSRFFTKNIYIPLGGNRKGNIRMYVNYLMVFFLSGLWHGAGWNFILWGMMHGILYVITKWYQEKKASQASLLSEKEGRRNGRREGLWKLLSCLLLFCYVSVAWVYFRAVSVCQANELLGNIFTKPWTLPGSGFLEVFHLGELWYVLKILKITMLPLAESYPMVLITIATLSITFFGENIEELAEKFRPSVINAGMVAILFLWCVISLSQVSTFLYFNF